MSGFCSSLQHDHNHDHTSNLKSYMNICHVQTNKALQTKKDIGET